VRRFGDKATMQRVVLEALTLPSEGPHHKGTICRPITKSAPFPNDRIAPCSNGRRPFPPRGPSLL
jgi:hypothetical protein